MGFSLTRPVLASFFSLFFLGRFSCLVQFYKRTLSYTSHFGFIFIMGVSLTHPVLASFLCREFVLHIPCSLHFCAGILSNTSRAASIFMRGVSLTHPMLPSFLCGEFLLHIPCWLPFMRGVSLTRPELTSLSYGVNGSEWIQALQTTQKTTILNIMELGGRWPSKRASKSLTQKTERSPTKL